MIKYIGSKRALVPAIMDVAARFPEAKTVLDAFSGTSRVAHALKSRGYKVIANDNNAYAHALATCYVQADRDRWQGEATRLIEELNALPGKPGYFTETFCIRSRYVQPSNGERIDAIRDRIQELQLDPELEGILLTSLLEAADRVDSTTGVQMAYLKQWASRSQRAIELRLPDILPGTGEAHRLDAVEALRRFDADLCYLDPPYNQHSYLGNYHVWESLVLWDKPEVYGIACKRMDCRERRSRFNFKTLFKTAMSELIHAVRAPVLVLSFSDEGYIQREELEAILRPRGEVAVLSHDYPRYVGSQIGIYNLDGKKVGKATHARNTEHLFVCAERLPDELRSAMTRS